MPPRPRSGPAPSARILSALPALLALLLLGGCLPAARRASWRVYPLPRHEPNDGLAVVTRPAGLGIHIWLETDTSVEGECRPRWIPDTARLLDGNGPMPRSSGRAPRSEFFEALGRGRVRATLRQQMEALCRQRAPRSVFLWSDPPRRPAEVRETPLPLIEERHLLSNPRAVRRAEKLLLGQPLTPEDFAEEEPPPLPPGP